MKQSKSYAQILKSTSLFGGVQIFSILMSVIKTKVITILIGANGFGIIGLLTSTTKLVTDITKIGLDTSAIKEISEYSLEEDDDKLFEFILVLNKIIWVTGTIGALLTIFFSNFLSIWTFGNTDYRFAFIWLSIAVLFNQLASGKKAILQGTRQLKRLAKANLLGSFLSLLVSLPLYYYFKEAGILPAIIAGFFIIYIVFFFYNKSTKNRLSKIGCTELFLKSKGLLRLGFTISFTSILGALTIWLIQIYIRDKGGVEDVGFYNAGLIIINSYVGLVFNAMGTDYFPRLSAVNKDKPLVNKLVNEQADVAILLITPIITLFIALAPLIVKLLYTEEFLEILGLITYGVLGTLFKAVSFSLGYVIIAKGDSKVFMKTSIVFNLLMLLICLCFYNQKGLTGLGLGLLIYHIFHFIALKILTYYLYGLKLSRKLYKIFLFCTCICMLSFYGTCVTVTYMRYIILILAALISIIFTIIEFNKRMNLKELLINNFFKRNK